MSTAPTAAPMSQSIPVFPPETSTPNQLMRFFIGLCTACDDPIWVHEFMNAHPDLDLNRPVPDAHDHDGLHLPLHAAAGEGHFKIMALLLSSPRINPGALDLHCKTAMAVAVDKQQTHAVIFLLHHPRLATKGVVHDLHIVSFLGDRDVSKGITGQPVRLREYLKFEIDDNRYLRGFLELLTNNAKETLYQQLANK